MTYQTPGIILKQIDRGEADQIFTIYTQKKGKILALGRGTKKIQSKLNSQLKSLAVIDLMIASGRNYDHIAAAQIQRNFLKIGHDLKKIVLASFALEIIDRLTKIGLRDEKIFFLLVKYFNVLDINQFNWAEWQMVKQAFTIKLLSLLGFTPSAEISQHAAKLANFLKYHLESELGSEK